MLEVNNMTAIVILVLAGSIILVLAVTAVYYLLQLRRALRIQREALAQQNLRLQVDIEKNIKSVKAIAHAILSDQVRIAEGAIRLGVLLERVGFERGEKENFIVFSTLANEIAHIPMLDAWNVLSRDEKRSYENELQAKEEQYRDFVRDSAKRLLEVL